MKFFISSIVEHLPSKVLITLNAKGNPQSCPGEQRANNRLVGAAFLVANVHSGHV
jgi:hypothetical protein